MENFELLTNYIKILEKKLKLNIIIYDEFRLLSHTKLAELSQIDKWHTNKYCTKIKENKALYHRCVYLKKYFHNKVAKSKGIIKIKCFCGVVEYVIPIRIQKHLVCFVAASGFSGTMTDKMSTIISNRIGLDIDEFFVLREHSLLKIKDEKTIICALEILAHLLEEYILNKTEIINFFTKDNIKKNKYIIKAMEYITQNYSKQINVESVAKYCYVSPSYLQHLFIEIIGHGVAEEIRLCRLAHAKELLCTTDYSIRYISYTCGFISYDYFFTIFKKHFQVSPLQYRKIHKYT